VTRESESQLIDFCVRQHGGFDAGLWLSFPHPDHDELAATCLFLASAEWYGHWRELVAVGTQLAPQDFANPEALISRTNFDCGRFTNMLRRELADDACVPP
jgi:hypothetical protein